jgi:ActR/RegA family two-component response regulator
MRYFASGGFGPSGVRSGSLVVCEPSVPFSSFSHRRVLLVDDDVVSLETWALLLADAGVRVEVAPDAEACLRLAGERAFDLIVIDFRLGEDSGLDVMRRLRARGIDVPFILATAHASVAVTVEAMRLGARTVLEKPLVGDEFVAPVLRELRAIETDRSPAPAAGRLAAERWARHVLRATEAAADPRTLADWARAAGVSRTVLIDLCARLEINPRHARDLARVLRLVRRASEPWDPESALDVADRRTLRNLLIRAGLADPPRGRPAPQQFLSTQRFVPQTNAGLVMLRQLLG